MHLYCAQQCFSTKVPLRVSGVLPKQTENARNGIRNHSSVRLYQYKHLDHCIGFHEERKHLRKVQLQQKG